MPEPNTITQIVRTEWNAIVAAPISFLVASIIAAIIIWIILAWAKKNEISGYKSQIESHQARVDLLKETNDELKNIKIEFDNQLENFKLQIKDLKQKLKALQEEKISSQLSRKIRETDTGLDALATSGQEISEKSKDIFKKWIEESSEHWELRSDKAGIANWLRIKDE